jgi:hypothetical protein
MALANITNNILTDTGVNVSSLTPTSTTISTTAPLQGGGDLSANRTLSITQSGTSANGFLSSTDWNTFNNKQAAGNYMTSLTGEATGTGPGATAVTLNNASVTAKVLTGVNITGGTVVATDSILTAFGKLQNQINGLIGSSIYQGVWNAATNTPALASGVGVRGYYYIVNVAGTTNLDGITDWFVGDWAIFDGTAWQQVDNTDAVVSVNGQTGAVSLTTDNIPEGSTNQYFLNSRARAALSFTAGSGAYNSTTGVITIPTNTSQLTNGANFITLASLSGTAPIQYNSSTGAISITQSGTSSNGFLSSTDWNTFNNKTSNTGTVTSVGLSSATSGVTIGSTPITTSGTITLAIATASGSQQGLLSSTDWTTFNNKQNALTNPVTGTGTTNYLPKFTGTSTIGDSNILIQGGGFYLAGSEIFTNANGGLFFNGNGSYATGIFGYSSSNNLRIIAPNQVDFYTASTQRMLLDASGNLGLGVTPSVWTLGKAIEIGNIGNAIWSVNATQYNILHNAYYNGGYVYASSNPASYYQQASGNHTWYNAPSGTAGNAISFTQAMTLNASGNLSIGNTNNTYKLDVTGTGYFSGQVNAATYLTLSEDGTYTGTYYTLGFSGKSNGANRIFGARDGSDGIYFAAATNRGFAFRPNGGTTDTFSIASTGAATFVGDVKVKTLEVTNVGTDATSSGLSTYMEITVNGQNYLIPLHGMP